MIRDPAFNTLYSPEFAPPWGSTIVKHAGYLIPLSAIKDDLPTVELLGSLDRADCKTPSEKLQDYCHGQALVDGAWYNLPQAIFQASKLSIRDYLPLPPFIIDEPETHVIDRVSRFGSGKGMQIDYDEDEGEDGGDRLFGRAGGIGSFLSTRAWDDKMPSPVLWYDSLVRPGKNSVPVGGKIAGGSLEVMIDDPNMAAY